MMEQIQKDIEPLLLLKYFSIFRHPLKAEEILKFCSGQETLEGLTQYLHELVSAGTIKEVEGYYILDGYEKDLEKRLKGEEKANELLPKARRMGHFIARFPFVKFVGISGSLSKGYANEHTDFDYFIITSNNTLWICRTILHLVKKMSFLIGKQHWMCMNYFIDEHHLELAEKNLFTQIELSTLIPVSNPALYRLFLLKNKDNLPNLFRLGIRDTGDAGLSKEKNKWLRSINLFFMKLTDAKWRNKWQRKGYPMEDYALAFKTTPYISKNHPQNTQKKILKHLQKDLS